MTQFITAISLWLHSVATVVLIGHYLLLAVIYLPAFKSSPVNPASGAILSEISKRSRSWMYASLVIFIVTGTYVMFVDPNYLGIGQFNNAWSILMLVKHILIIGMLGLGFWYNAILRVGPLMSSNSGAAQALNRFQQYANLMTVTGLLVLLLTALSQAQ
jgi:uncharacterized membrane protein